MFTYTTKRFAAGVLLVGILSIALFQRYVLAEHLFKVIHSTPLQQVLDLVAGDNALLPNPLRLAIDGVGGPLTRSGVVTATNQQRASFNLAPLHENAKLNRAAELKLKDMFEKQYFEHVSPDGKGPSDLADAVGYRYLVVGENLALGRFKNDQDLVEAWMNSPGHRANILNDKYQEIGVAVGEGTFEGKSVWLAVQSFGTPASVCPAPSSSERVAISANQERIDFLRSEVDRLKAELEASRSDREAYNQKVKEYNAMVVELNNLIRTTQDLVRTYNASVDRFNACLEKNS